MLAWRGKEDNRINVMTSELGLLLGHKVTLAETAQDRPRLCTTGNRAFLAWQGTGNNFVNVMASYDGANWSNKNTFQRARGGPAITPFGSILVRAWADAAPPHMLSAQTSTLP